MGGVPHPGPRHIMRKEAWRTQRHDQASENNKGKLLDIGLGHDFFGYDQN